MVGGSNSRGVTLIVSNFEVTVEKLVYGGDGLARLDGRVVFAPFVLPGERILARAEQEKPGMVRARMLEVLEAAPDRVAAPCPVFGRCGGCHYQHAPYEYQLAAKRGDSGGSAAAAREDRAAGGDRGGRRRSRSAIAIACSCTWRRSGWDIARRARTSCAP